MRAISALMIVSALAGGSGCATEAGLRKLADTTIGHSENQLVARLGPPDSTFTTDSGVKHFTYRRGNAGVVPGYGQVNCAGGRCFSYYVPAQQYAYVCTMTFALEGGIVKSYRYEGNGCVA